MPWHPFQGRPNDAEPPVAALWLKKLSATMSTVAYDTMKAKFPAWVQPFDQKYQAAMQVVQAAQPQPPLPKGVTIQGKADQTNIGAEEQAALHPGSQPQAPTRPTQPTQPQGGKPLGGRVQ